VAWPDRAGLRVLLEIAVVNLTGESTSRVLQRIRLMRLRLTP
jgi:hypothetical protein